MKNVMHVPFRRLIFFGVVLALALFAVFFFDNNRVQTVPVWTGEMTSKDGVQYIKNPDRAVLEDVSLSPNDQVLAFPESGAEDTIALAYPLDIDVNSHHDVAIIDNVIGKIIVLDSLFNVVQTYGDGKGKGPKQFNVAYSVYLADDRTVAIADYQNHRLQYFYPDGRVAVHNLTVSGQIMGLQVAPLDEVRYVLTRYARERVWRLDAGLNATVVYRDSVLVPFEDTIRNTIMNENIIALTASRDLLFAYKYKPLIVVIGDDGKHDRLIHYKPLYEIENEILSGNHHGDAHTYLSMSAVCVDIVSDEADNIYVLSRVKRKGEDYAVLCFDPRGRFLQKIFLPQGQYKALDVRDGYLYLLLSGRGEDPMPRCEKYLLPAQTARAGFGF